MGVNLYCAKCKECGNVCTFDEYAWEEVKELDAEDRFVCESCKEKSRRDDYSH